MVSSYSLSAKAVWKVFSKEAVSILQLSQQAGISTVIGGWFNSKGKEQIIMIDSFFLVIKNEDSCEGSRHDAVIFMFFVEQDAVVTTTSWPEETTGLCRA